MSLSFVDRLFGSIMYCFFFFTTAAVTVNRYTTVCRNFSYQFATFRTYYFDFFHSASACFLQTLYHQNIAFTTMPTLYIVLEEGFYYLCSTIYRTFDIFRKHCDGIRHVIVLVLTVYREVSEEFQHLIVVRHSRTRRTVSE